MAYLRLACLGPPEAWLDEQPLAFPTRKALALLIYLVVEGGLQPRPKLMVLFWPDSDTTRGRSALRSTLAYLRRALDTVSPNSSRYFLHVDADTIGFNFEAEYELDTQAIELATGQQGINNLAILQQAIDQYRGNFSEGFSLPDAPEFDDWLNLQQEQWHQAMHHIFDRLAQAQLDTRHFEAAISTAACWVRHDSLHEAAYRRLIAAHALAGNNGAALQVYQACQSVLQAELALKPSPATQALAERIRDFRIAADDFRSAEAGPIPNSIIKDTISDLPFVGRSAEHARLVDLFRLAQAGQTQAVVIEGEAGLGKSRLVAEFLAGIKLQGVDVLGGRAFETGGRLPYQPLVDALRRRLDVENAPDDFLADVWLVELSRLLPELRERYPDLPPPEVDETLGRIRLFEAVTRLGKALTRRQPVAFFVDDIHWADTASLDLLIYAGRAWAADHVPILLLLTLRLEALITGPEVRDWVMSLSRDMPLTRLSLNPLTVTETEQLVTLVRRQQGDSGTLVDPSPSHAVAIFAQWLYKETAGQPFFINETLRVLPAQNWEPDNLPSKGILPPGVRQVVLTRLAKHSPESTALLTASAVLGRPCSFERLCQITGISEMEALPNLEILLDSRLLLETGDVANPYTFAHDKIRDVVYTEAGDARRRIYHRRAFEALAQIAAPPAELAHHALSARLVEPAFKYSIAAGDAASQIFAVHDAISNYEQARALMIHYQSFDAAQAKSLVSKLYANLARAYEVVEEPDQVETICREMLALAQKFGWSNLECIALNRLASIAIYTQQMDRATTLLRQAKRVAEASGDTAGLAQTEWSLGQLTHHINDFDASKEHCERALALAQEINDPTLIAGASNSLAYALFFLGQVEKAARVMEEARAGFAALGDRALEADSLVGLAGAHILSGRVEASIAAAQAALAIGQEIENAFGQAMSRAWLIFGLVDRGDYEEALALAQQNLEAGRTQELAPKLVATFTAGLVYWAVGDYVAAQSVHLELMPHLYEAGVPGYLEQINANLCMDAALAGNWDEANTYARQALKYRDYRALPLFIAPHWPETEALLRGGDIELAREDIHHWGELVGSVLRFRVGYLRSLALLARWDEDVDQAIAYLQEALTLVEQIGLPGEQFQILAKLGELYGTIGEEAQARQALDKAGEIVQALAARIKAEDLKNSFLQAIAL